jgi:signal transduction histidine kinase
MSVSVASVRRLVVEGWNPRELLERVGRALTAAIEGGTPPVAVDVDGSAYGLPLPARLRIATFIALATGVLFLPVETRQVPSDAIAALLLLYTCHAVFMSGILIVSFTATGERHADRLGLLLVLGHAANLHIFLYVWPTYPGLVGGVLSCLLVGSSVLFSWNAKRVSLLAAIVCTGFLLVGVVTTREGVLHPSFAVAWIALVVGGATAIGCARLLVLLRQSLTERQSELTHLSNRLMSVQEEERRRLSRDLHDEFGQSLTAVNAYLWLIERHPAGDPEGLRSRTAEARRVVGKTLAAMRELSHLLRPSVLDDFGLLPSLDTLLKAFAERHQIATSLTTDGLPERLPAEFETALYRITQEALTNVARHARASRVRVALAAIGDELRLEIEDDGVGLPPKSANGTRAGTGLVGIRERARALGGHITVTSRKGVCLVIRFPLPALIPGEAGDDAD